MPIKKGIDAFVMVDLFNREEFALRSYLVVLMPVK